MTEIREDEAQRPAASAGSDSLDRIVSRRPPVGARSVDSSLGDSIFFGPSLLNLLGNFGLAFLIIGIGWLAPTNGSWWTVSAGLVFGLIGLWAAQTSLVVGTEGFRFSGPLGSSEIGWDQVSRPRSRYSFWLRLRRIDVALNDGSVMTFGYLAFSDSHDAVSDLMEDCLAAWREAHPAAATDRSPWLPKPTEGVIFSRGRRPLAFGLGAVAMVAVVCLASAWRWGAFDSLMRGAPAAPKVGHWNGSNPAVSFDIRADGQMANVHLDVDDLPFASCSLWASVIPVAPDHTFSSVLGSTPDNLLASSVEVKGTFYGATAFGTYTTVVCPGALPAAQGRAGKWSAQWLSP